MTEPIIPVPRPAADVIDIGPRLQKKKQKTCDHSNCAVDMDAAALWCLDCDLPLDPWWFIRRDASSRDAALAQRNKLYERHEKWCQDVKALEVRLTAEIQHLYDVKNRLQNESVHGERLGNLARRRRRRAPATSPTSPPTPTPPQAFAKILDADGKL